jgi:hypothetical protein
MGGRILNRYNEIRRLAAIPIRPEQSELKDQAGTRFAGKRKQFVPKFFAVDVPCLHFRGIVADFPTEWSNRILRGAKACRQQEGYYYGHIALTRKNHSKLAFFVNKSD